MNQQMRDVSRQLRQDATRAEDVLWQCIRNRKLLHNKLRRQHIVGTFVLDFSCHEAGLGIDIDGSIHNEVMQRHRDGERQEILEELGIRVIRFTNHQIMNDIDCVLNNIYRELSLRD